MAIITMSVSAFISSVILGMIAEAIKELLS